MAATTFKNVASATTDSVVIPAIENRIIRVFGVAVNCGATATLVVFNTKGSSSGTPISANFNLGAYGSVVLPQPANISTRTLWFQTNAGESLTVNTGAGSTVGIQVVYDVYLPLTSIRVIVSPFSSYTVSNVSNITSFDADDTTLDEIASVLGSLIILFQTGTTITSSFSATNVTPTYSYDATNTSLDELADVLGTLIASLTATGTSSDAYTVSNVTTAVSFDATNTTLTEIAFVLGSVLATLRGAGNIQ